LKKTGGLNRETMRFPVFAFHLDQATAHQGSLPDSPFVLPVNHRDRDERCETASIGW
jgi:hypothetical protein